MPKFPSVPGTTTISTMSESSRRSGVTSSNWTRSGIELYPASGGLRRHLLRLGDGVLDRADHVEGAFRQIVVISADDALKAFDRVFEIDKHARTAGEHLGDKEGLRQKALDLAGARHGQLVLLG